MSVLGEMVSLPPRAPVPWRSASEPTLARVGPARRSQFGRGDRSEQGSGGGPFKPMPSALLQRLQIAETSGAHVTNACFHLAARSDDLTSALLRSPSKRD